MLVVASILLFADCWPSLRHTQRLESCSRTETTKAWILVEALPCCPSSSYKMRKALRKPGTLRNTDRKCLEISI